MSCRRKKTDTDHDSSSLVQTAVGKHKRNGARPGKNCKKGGAVEPGSCITFGLPGHKFQPLFSIPLFEVHRENTKICQVIVWIIIFFNILENINISTILP